MINNKQIKTETEAVKEITENNYWNNTWRGGAEPRPTTVYFNDAKAFLSKCKNYIRVKYNTGTVNYMLKRKMNRRTVHVEGAFSHLKLKELKVICKAHGLKVAGTKNDLNTRIEAHMLTVGEEE
jgi:hypothetical protein